jgi:hypothetical protein
MKKSKNTSWVLHISVSIGEIEISYSRINENENNFMGSLYDHGLPIFSNKLYFK